MTGARSKEYAAGQKVFVLQPALESMQAEWPHTFETEKILNENDYAVNVGGRRKKLKLFTLIC